MAENIVMQITEECNPSEARFRAGDFLIGTQTALNLLKNQSGMFSDKYYTIENSTIKDLKESKSVKYHHVSKESFHDFKFVTIHKDIAIKHLLNKKQIAINHHDKRILKDFIDEKEQNHFLYDMANHESECVLNGDWTTWTNINYKLPQINYYKSLKSDQDRQIYADAIGQQYALNLIFSPIHKGIDEYGLEHFNTFFKNIEFYFDDTINQNENQDDNNYLTSLNIKELWLPAEHFEIENPSDIKTVNNKQYIKVSQINEALERYSFQTNRVYYDSDWWDNFLIKL
ncbi:MAG: hypothetical protein D8H99_10155 [Streptococcus sp.]|nr:MAG: hypothetical protein D8H99_10155 [Streptococcus sp.]